MKRAFCCFIFLILSVSAYSATLNGTPPRVRVLYNGAEDPRTKNYEDNLNKAISDEFFRTLQLKREKLKIFQSDSHDSMAKSYSDGTSSFALMAPLNAHGNYKVAGGAVDIGFNTFGYDPDLINTRDKYYSDMQEIPSAMLGINLSKLVDGLYMKLRGTYRHINIPEEDNDDLFQAVTYESKVAEIGLGVDYRIIDSYQSYDSFFTFSGLFLETGFSYGYGKIKKEMPEDGYEQVKKEVFNYSFSEFIPSLGRTYTSKFDMDYVVSPFMTAKVKNITLPLGVYTSMQFYELLNLYMSLGADLAFTRTEVKLSAYSPETDLFLYNIDSGNSGEDIKIETMDKGEIIIDGEGKSSPVRFNPRASLGLGLNVEVVKFDIIYTRYLTGLNLVQLSGGIVY